MIKVLEGFHHQAARYITGMAGKRGAGREWDYPSVVEVMETAGLHPIRIYTSGQQATISERVAFHPIYELRTDAGHIPGTSQLVQWWYQDTVN